MTPMHYIDIFYSQWEMLGQVSMKWAEFLALQIQIVLYHN